MIGLDTNILLRYLAQDDPTHSPRATEIIERRLTEQEPGFVSLVSILEVAWVLKSLFKRSRQEIANDIEMLLAADTLEVQNEQEVYYAVVSLRNGIGTFEDALIGSLGLERLFGYLDV
jgi:predicted nucleic-acid-binding protein